MRTTDKSMSNVVVRDERPTTDVAFTKYERAQRHVVERFLKSNDLVSRPTADGMTWRSVTEVDIERANRGHRIRLVAPTSQLAYLRRVADDNGIGFLSEL